MLSLLRIIIIQICHQRLQRWLSMEPRIISLSKLEMLLQEHMFPLRSQREQRKERNFHSYRSVVEIIILCFTGKEDLKIILPQDR